MVSRYALSTVLMLVTNANLSLDQVPMPLWSKMNFTLIATCPGRTLAAYGTGSDETLSLVGPLTSIRLPRIQTEVPIVQCMISTLLNGRSPRSKGPLFQSGVATPSYFARFLVHVFSLRVHSFRGERSMGKNKAKGAFVNA